MSLLRACRTETESLHRLRLRPGGRLRPGVRFGKAQIETHYNLARIAEGLEKGGVAVR